MGEIEGLNFVNDKDFGEIRQEFSTPWRQCKDELKQLLNNASNLNFPNIEIPSQVRAALNINLAKPKRASTAMLFNGLNNIASELVKEHYRISPRSIQDIYLNHLIKNNFLPLINEQILMLKGEQGVKALKEQLSSYCQVENPRNVINQYQTSIETKLEEIILFLEKLQQKIIKANPLQDNDDILTKLNIQKLEEALKSVKIAYFNKFQKDPIQLMLDIKKSINDYTPTREISVADRFLHKVSESLRTMLHDLALSRDYELKKQCNHLRDGGDYTKNLQTILAMGSKTHQECLEKFLVGDCKKIAMQCELGIPPSTIFLNIPPDKKPATAASKELKNISLKSSLVSRYAEQYTILREIIEAITSEDEKLRLIKRPAWFRHYIPVLNLLITETQKHYGKSVLEISIVETPSNKKDFYLALMNSDPSQLKKLKKALLNELKKQIIKSLQEAGIEPLPRLILEQKARPSLTLKTPETKLDTGTDWQKIQEAYELRDKLNEAQENAFTKLLQEIKEEENKNTTLENPIKILKDQINILKIEKLRDDKPIQGPFVPRFSKETAITPPGATSLSPEEEARRLNNLNDLTHKHNLFNQRIDLINLFFLMKPVIKEGSYEHSKFLSSFFKDFLSRLEDSKIQYSEIYDENNPQVKKEINEIVTLMFPNDPDQSYQHKDFQQISNEIKILNKAFNLSELNSKGLENYEDFQQASSLTKDLKDFYPEATAQRIKDLIDITLDAVESNILDLEVILGFDATKLELNDQEIQARYSGIQHFYKENNITLSKYTQETLNKINKHFLNRSKDKLLKIKYDDDVLKKLKLLEEVTASNKLASNSTGLKERITEINELCSNVSKQEIDKLLKELNTQMSDLSQSNNLFSSEEEERRCKNTLNKLERLFNITGYSEDLPPTHFTNIKKALEATDGYNRMQQVFNQLETLVQKKKTALEDNILIMNLFLEISELLDKDFSLGAENKLYFKNGKSLILNDRQEKLLENSIEKLKASKQKYFTLFKEVSKASQSNTNQNKLKNPLPKNKKINRKITQKDLQQRADYIFAYELLLKYLRDDKSKNSPFQEEEQDLLQKLQVLNSAGLEPFTKSVTIETIRNKLQSILAPDH